MDWGGGSLLNRDNFLASLLGVAYVASREDTAMCGHLSRILYTSIVARRR